MFGDGSHHIVFDRSRTTSGASTGYVASLIVTGIVVTVTCVLVGSGLRVCCIAPGGYSLHSAFLEKLTLKERSHLKNMHKRCLNASFRSGLFLMPHSFVSQPAEQGVFIMDEKTKLDAAAKKAAENGEEDSQLSDEDLEAAAGGCGPNHRVHHHYSGTQKPGTQKPGTRNPGYKPM